MTTVNSNVELSGASGQGVQGPGDIDGFESFMNNMIDGFSGNDASEALGIVRIIENKLLDKLNSNQAVIGTTATTGFKTQVSDLQSNLNAFHNDQDDGFSKVDASQVGSDQGWRAPRGRQGSARQRQQYRTAASSAQFMLEKLYDVTTAALKAQSDPDNTDGEFQIPNGPKVKLKTLAGLTVYTTWLEMFKGINEYAQNIYQLIRTGIEKGAISAASS